MNNILISQNKHWENTYKNLYERDVFQKLLTNLQTKHIQILQGISRSGKSSLFKLMINYLSQSTEPKDILYINLDDPFFTKYSNDPKSFYEIIQTAKKLTQKDTIENIEVVSFWEYFLNKKAQTLEKKKLFKV